MPPSALSADQRQYDQKAGAAVPTGVEAAHMGWQRNRASAVGQMPPRPARLHSFHATTPVAQGDGLLNLLRAPSPEVRQRLNAYWANNITRLRHRQIWRVNPFALAWHGARDIKNPLVFLKAMSEEQY